MRKADTLRKMVRKKVREVRDIYYLDVASFRRRGDYKNPCALPLEGYDTEGNYGVIGVSIMHPILCIEDDGTWWVDTWYEDFVFMPSNKKIKKDCA